MADFNDILGSDATHIQAVELISFQPTVRTQSLSGRSQVRTFGGQLFSMKIQMPPMTASDLRKVYGFLVSKKGGFSSFTIAPHNLKQVGGTQGTSVGCGAGAIGATSITLDSGTGLYKMGDMIKFSGHDKAYMISQDQGGTTTINFEPGLIAAVGSSETIESGSAFEMTVRLDGDTFTYQQGNDGYGTIEFDVIEAV
tara:strand:+ start:1630 stop:2220 length:591 start_codon:yes stop_codon:yes gene_type:complete